MVFEVVYYPEIFRIGIGFLHVFESKHLAVFYGKLSSRFQYFLHVFFWQHRIVGYSRKTIYVSFEYRRKRGSAYYDRISVGPFFQYVAFDPVYLLRASAPVCYGPVRVLRAQNLIPSHVGVYFERVVSLVIPVLLYVSFFVYLIDSSHSAVPVYPFSAFFRPSAVVFVKRPVVPFAVYQAVVVFVEVSSAFYIDRVPVEYVVVVWIRPYRLVSIYVPAMPFGPDSGFYLGISSSCVVEYVLAFEPLVSVVVVVQHRARRIEPLERVHIRKLVVFHLLQRHSKLYSHICSVEGDDRAVVVVAGLEGPAFVFGELPELLHVRLLYCILPVHIVFDPMLVAVQLPHESAAFDLSVF